MLLQFLAVKMEEFISEIWSLLVILLFNMTTVLRCLINYFMINTGEYFFLNDRDEHTICNFTSRSYISPYKSSINILALIWFSWNRLLNTSKILRFRLWCDIAHRNAFLKNNSMLRCMYMSLINKSLLYIIPMTLVMTIFLFNLPTRPDLR